MRVDLSFMRAALDGARIFYQGCEITDLSSFPKNIKNLNTEVGISFDSREFIEQDFFIALKGARVDGHQFVQEVVLKGASGVLVSDESLVHTLNTQECLIVLVPDTYKALIDLAKAWRKLITCPVVGITGSIGKTSTKEIIREILKISGVNYYVSLRNQNTFIGLCANILRIPQDLQVAILEVGISEPGEMISKSDILRPTMGVITLIAHSHISQFGSIKTIANEKRQLFAHFGENNIGIICGDQSFLLDQCYFHPVARYGFKTINQVQARRIKTINDSAGNLKTSFILKSFDNKTFVKINGYHKGLIYNMLAACAVANFLKIPFECVTKALENFNSFSHRFQSRVIKNNRGVIISDCYNANPESTRAALDAFKYYKWDGQKIIILGDMKELGIKERYWHRYIGRVVSKLSGVSKVITVGQLAKDINKVLPESLNSVWAQDWSGACNYLEDFLKNSPALVLIKASHSMSLDNITDHFCE